jgi:hypothetical protein
MKYYLGIDNGVSGGLVALSTAPGLPPLAMLPMPVKRARKGNEVDVREVLAWLNLHEIRLSECMTIIEEPGGSKSAKAATSMAGAFHALRAMLEVHRARYERVTPHAWQRVMLPGCKPGETKERALETAQRLWPGTDWRATDRCRLPHDGLIDAALIAEYGRRAGL